MDKGGRPKNVIWNDFLCVKEGNKTYGKCRRCGHTMANRVDRMKMHSAKCKSAVQQVQEERKDSVNEEQTVQMDIDTEGLESNIPVKGSEKSCTLLEESECVSKAAGVKRVCMQQNIIDHYIVKTTPNIKKQLDLQVAKFFYSCNIPFNVVEQDEFVKLIQLLHPGYKPPTRKALSGGLLDEVTEALENKMKLELQGKECTLVEDGWSNIHNEAIIASCLHVEGGNVFFLEATECAGQPKTAEFCKEKVKGSITLAKDKFACTVTSVVTDNEKKMQKMRQLLKEENDDLLVYGCCAHWMNLLGQEITPPSIMKHVVEIQKYFRNHHLPAAWLCELHDTVKPQLPNDTRWNSQLTCINTFIRNRSAYVKICEDHDIESRMVQLINNYNLYQQVKELQMQLKPLADLLDMVQGNNATLADACRAWLLLAEDSNLAPHHDAVVKRMKAYIQPFHYLAYMTHPVYKGELLNDEQREAARTWLLEVQSTFLTFLIAFEAESPPYPGSFFLVQNVKASIWWKGLKKTSIPPDFIQLMVRLHSSPCSSASIERIFSNFGLIHSKLRNKLGVQKASKLVFCYRMLRGKKELEWD